MVCLAVAQAVPDQTSCLAPVDDATSLEQKQVRMPTFVNGQARDGDMTSLMQTNHQVIMRSNATDQIRAQPSTSKGDKDRAGFCVKDNFVKAYNVYFRRYAANTVRMGSVGVKEAGWFYAGFKRKEEQKLWDPQGINEDYLTHGPTDLDTQYDSEFKSQVSAAIKGAGEVSGGGNGGSSASSKVKFMSQEFRSVDALVDAFNAAPKALAWLRKNKANARVVTGVLVLSAASTDSMKRELGAFGSASASVPTQPTATASVSASTSSSAEVQMPADQTLAYEISRPEWKDEKRTELVDFIVDEMCGFDDAWLGSCSC